MNLSLFFFSQVYDFRSDKHHDQGTGQLCNFFKVDKLEHFLFLLTFFVVPHYSHTPITQMASINQNSDWNVLSKCQNACLLLSMVQLYRHISFDE